MQFHIKISLTLASSNNVELVYGFSDDFSLFISQGAVFGAFVVIVIVAIAPVMFSPFLLTLNITFVSSGLIVNFLLLSRKE